MSDKHIQAHQEAERIAVRRVGPIVYAPWPAGIVAAIISFAVISLFSLVAGLDSDLLMMPSLISSIAIAACVFMFYWLHQREFYKVYVSEMQRLLGENE